MLLIKTPAWDTGQGQDQTELYKQANKQTRKPALVSYFQIITKGLLPSYTSLITNVSVKEILLWFLPFYAGWD